MIDEESIRWEAVGLGLIPWYVYDWHGFEPNLPVQISFGHQIMRPHVWVKLA